MPAFAFLKVLPTQWHRLLQAFHSVVCWKRIRPKQGRGVVQQRCRGAHRQGSCQRGYRHCCLQGNLPKVIRFGSLKNCDIQESVAKIPLFLSCQTSGGDDPTLLLHWIFFFFFFPREKDVLRNQSSFCLHVCSDESHDLKSQLMNLKALICRTGILCYLIEQEESISNPCEF